MATIKNTLETNFTSKGAPKVVKETIGKDLPEGFQTSEFLKEKGFIDIIVDRKDLREKISQLFRIMKK